MPPNRLPKLVPLDLIAADVDVHGVGIFSRHSFHGVHEAEGGAEDQVEALARQGAEDLFGVGAFGDVLDVGDMRIFDVLSDVFQAFVVSLRPTTIIMWSNQDHGNVELALLNIGDLEGPDGFGFRAAGAQNERQKQYNGQSTHCS